MRILSLSTHNIPCGIGDMNAALRRAMESNGHKYDVVPITREMRNARAGCFDGFFSSLSDYDGALVQHEHGFFGPSESRATQSFYKFLDRMRRSGKPCIVVLHTNFHIGRVSGGIKRLSHHYSSRQIWRRKLVRLVNNSPRLMLVVHGTASYDALLALGVDENRVTKIHLPMKEVSSQPVKEWNEDKIKLGIFGFIADYKGYMVALEALLHLPDRFHLVVAGGKHPYNRNDQTLDNIYKFIETGFWYGENVGRKYGDFKNLSGRVSITGYIEDIQATYADIDIVLAPYVELFPAGSAALSESLCRGKPIIASATPSFSEIYDDGKALKLVAMRAPFELAAAILELASNKEERARLSEAALQFSRINSWSNCAARFVEILTAAGSPGDASIGLSALKSHEAA